MSDKLLANEPQTRALHRDNYDTVIFYEQKIFVDFNIVDVSIFIDNFVSDIVHGLYRPL
jgi:hypothetical protein